MTEMRKWVAGAVVVALVLLTAGWTLLIAPKRSEAADLREQVAVQEASTEQLETQLVVLRQKAAGLPQQEAVLKEVDRLLPAQAALPELVRALTEASRSAGVELVSVAPGTLAPVAAAAGAPPADGTAAATAPPAGADPAQAAASPAATGTLMALPVSLDVSGGFYELEQFLAELEELPRALRVTALTMSAGAVGPDELVSPRTGIRIGLKLTAEVYVSAPAPTTAPETAGPGAPAVAAPSGAVPATAGTAVTPTTES